MQALLQRWLKKLEARRDRVTTPPDAQGSAAGAESIRLGNAALAAGDLAAAEAHYREAMAASPQDPLALTNLGYVLLEQGDPAKAEPVLTQAAATGAGADAQFLLGQTRAALGHWDAARQSYREAVMLRPDFGFAWRGLGVAWENLGDLPTALDAYERAARHSPELVDAFAACARLQLALGRFDRAQEAAGQWEVAAPQEWGAPFMGGQALHALQREDEALLALDRSLALAPDNPAVLHTRGNVLFAMDRMEEAQQCYGHALQGAPDWIEPMANRGVALDRIGRVEESLACFERVLAQQPDHKLALYQRPMLLVSLGRVTEALDAVTHARQLYPQDADVEWHYGFAHLLAGDMRRGWPAYEARWRATATGSPLSAQPFKEPLWTGQPLQGRTLLLYPEQGLGDMLQFARFVPELERRGARVLVWSPASLQSLIATVSPLTVVASRVEDLPAFDYQCPIMSVPLALGTTSETLPGQVPYLHSDAARRKRWAQKLGERTGPRIGVVWSGNPAQQNDRHRSMPLATFAGIDLPGCEFIALQNAIRPEDLPALRSWKALRFFGDDIRDFADTAALAAEMDLVISVCTSGAHLAGAIGMPLWVLLSYRADWRWLLERDDSPWYPTARLYRQDASRSWEAVIARVREALVLQFGEQLQATG